MTKDTEQVKVFTDEDVEKLKDQEGYFSFGLLKSSGDFLDAAQEMSDPLFKNINHHLYYMKNNEIYNVYVDLKTGKNYIDDVHSKVVYPTTMDPNSDPKPYAPVGVLYLVNRYIDNPYELVPCGYDVAFTAFKKDQDLKSIPMKTILTAFMYYLQSDTFVSYDIDLANLQGIVEAFTPIDKVPEAAKLTLLSQANSANTGSGNNSSSTPNTPPANNDSSNSNANGSNSNANSGNAGTNNSSSNNASANNADNGNNASAGTNADSGSGTETKSAATKSAKAATKSAK